MKHPLRWPGLLSLCALVACSGADAGDDLFQGGTSPTAGQAGSSGQSGSSGSAGQAGGSSGQGGQAGSVNPAGGTSGSSGEGGSGLAGKGGSGGAGGSGQAGKGGSGGSGQAGSGGSGGSGQAGSGGSGQAGSGGSGGGAAGGGGAGGSGQAGSSAAGSGGSGGGTAGQGGSGVAGSGGSGGSGQAGSGQAGSGQAGSGQAGSGQAGSGQAGSGQAGSGQAGSGVSGSSGQGGTGGAPAECGDGKVSGGEVCDGSNFAGKTCASETGFDGSEGALKCDPSCQSIDTSDCTQAPVCGNGLLEGNEECDGGELGGLDCSQATGGKLPTGELKCQPNCTFDTTGCKAQAPFCGDGVRNGPEKCDGKDLAMQSCGSLVPGSSGELKCQGDCQFDTSGCQTVAGVCGDGKLGDGEQCDDGNTNNGDGCDENCQVACLEGEAQFGTHCYREYTTNRSWQDASTFCQNNGGYLVSITSDAEQTFIESSVLSPPQSEFERRWIGLNDIAAEGKFVWSSNEPFGSFTIWANNEPNNESQSGNNADCVNLFANSGNWSDDSCFRQLRYICEYPPPVKTP